MHVLIYAGNVFKYALTALSQSVLYRYLRFPTYCFNGQGNQYRIDRYLEVGENVFANEQYFKLFHDGIFVRLCSALSYCYTVF